MPISLVLSPHAPPFTRWRESLAKLLVGWSQPLYAPFKRRRSTPWTTSFESLKAYPQDSLGYALWELLSQQNLRLMPPFEDHDVFHLVFGYGLTVQEEARLQFCLLGSRKHSLYVWGTCLIAFLLFPEKWSSYRTAFLRGRRAQYCADWPWESLLSLPLTTLQNWVFKI